MKKLWIAWKYATDGVHYIRTDIGIFNSAVDAKNHLRSENVGLRLVPTSDGSYFGQTEASGRIMEFYVEPIQYFADGVK